MTPFADLITAAAVLRIARWLWQVEVAARAAWDERDQGAFDDAVEQARGGS